MTSHREYLLEWLSKGTIENPIEKREKVFSLLNSLIDDQKNGKAPRRN